MLYEVITADGVVVVVHRVDGMAMRVDLGRPPHGREHEAHDLDAEPAEQEARHELGSVLVAEAREPGEAADAEDHARDRERNNFV